MCQGWKQKLRGRLVVPDMRAVSKAAATLVIAAFKAVELAISGTETSLGHQRRKVRRGCVAEGTGESAGAHNCCERFGPFFQLRKVCGGVLRGGPSIREARAIVVADDVVFMALRRGPPGPSGRAI